MSELMELKTINGAKPRNYEYFTDEMAAEYGLDLVNDAEEIQAMRNALYELENTEPVRSDYYYNVYLKAKDAVK